MKTGGLRRWTVGLCAVAVLATVAVGPGHSAASTAGGVASPVGSDPCPGDLELVGDVAGDGAPPMCTHGVDPAVTSDDLMAEGGVTSQIAAGVQCYGDGTGGKRVQLLYAHASTLDRFAALKPAIEQRAAAIEAIYDASAIQTGGRRHVRWVTDANCDLDIRSVTVPSAAIAVTGFRALSDSLMAQGFNRPDRKYLVWVDTNTPSNVTSASCLGLGTLFRDDRKSAQNFNEISTGYTRVDETCLFRVLDSIAGKVEAHELMHTMGAVQASAPNATGGGHCQDDFDIMCYDDDGSGPVQTRQVCPVSNELRLDCNHDDYFATSPRAGSYLATHWNPADSGWFESGLGHAVVPGPPGSVVGVPGDGQIALTWAAPSSDGGADIIAYKIFRDGSPVQTVTTPSNRAFTDVGLTNGTGYSYQVSAVNSEGAGPKSAAVSVMAGLPRPDAQIGVSKSGPFIGDNVYFPSITRNPQVQSQKVAGGGSATYFVNVQNDRPGVDSLIVKGVAAGAAGYTVKYYLGTDNITDEVEAGSYTISGLPAGQSVVLKVKIKAPTAAAGSTRTVTVTVKSKTTKTIKDVVQAQAERT